MSAALFPASPTPESIAAVMEDLRTWPAQLTQGTQTAHEFLEQVDAFLRLRKEAA